jgi:hypothetical protein
MYNSGGTMNFGTLFLCSFILAPFVGLLGLTIVRTAFSKLVMITLLSFAVGSTMFHIVLKIYAPSPDYEMWVGPGGEVVTLFFNHTWIVVAYLLILGFGGYHLNRVAEKRLRRLGQSPQDRKHKSWIDALYYDGEKSE